MARRRRHRGVQPYRILIVGLLLICGVFVYRWWPVDSPPEAPPRLTSDRPETPASVPEQMPELGQEDLTTSATSAATVPAPSVDAERSERVDALIAAGREAHRQADLLTARAQWTEALKLGVSGADGIALRADLTRLGEETIFSPRVIRGDPLVDLYVVQSGDTLGKIAKANQVPDDLIEKINGLPNKDVIRVGQTVKVIHGPFHAVVDKSSYGMDVYCQDTFVKHFAVGLGANDSTPAGKWKVSNKLVDPIWYPPRGGQIMSASDPENPLGERWIGLDGVDGDAVGQMRYGIHGTIEPDSIGKSVSLGCIRMHNPDVEFVFDLLVDEFSQVTVKEGP